eukprot:364882-Chlamydomonas_euryale.AAC.1
MSVRSSIPLLPANSRLSSAGSTSAAYVCTTCAHVRITAGRHAVWQGITHHDVTSRTAASHIMARRHASQRCVMHVAAHVHLARSMGPRWACFWAALGAKP